MIPRTFNDWLWLLAALAISIAVWASVQRAPERAPQQRLSAASERSAT